MDQLLTMAVHIFRLTCLVTLCHTALFPVQAQNSATMTVSSTDNLNGVNTGESISINCTVTVPEGVIIGFPIFTPAPGTGVSWGRYPTQYRTSNASVRNPEIYPRLSVSYFQDGIDHTYQLTISDVQLTDLDTYFCRALTSVPGDLSSRVVLRELVHVSIGDRLYEDTPQCNIDPGVTILDGQTFTPTCILKREDTSLTVDWTLQYPNGTFKKANYRTTITEGVNFVSYALNVYEKGSVLDNGLTFFCSVKTSNKNCSVELSVIAGPEVSGNNLIGANIGDTMTITATMTFPKDSGFSVSHAAWSKLSLDGREYINIIDDEVIRSDRVDPNRFSVQISESNDETYMYTNTMTITDAKESDSGQYVNTLNLEPTGENGESHFFLNFLSVTVIYDSYPTTEIPTTTMKPDQGGLTTTQSSTSTQPTVEYSSTHMPSTTMLSTLATTSSKSPRVSSEMMTKPDKSTPTKKSGGTGRRSAGVAVGITIPIVVIIIIIIIIILIMLYKRHSAEVKSSKRSNVGMAPVAYNDAKA